jgi:hypothetical protein
MIQLNGIGPVLFSRSATGAAVPLPIIIPQFIHPALHRKGHPEGGIDEIDNENEKQDF